MPFEIRLKNGYTGETVKMLVLSGETPEELAERLKAVWSLPNIPHTLVFEDKVLERKATFSSSKVRAGAQVEIVPDPTVL